MIFFRLRYAALISSLLACLLVRELHKNHVLLPRVVSFRADRKGGVGNPTQSIFNLFFSLREVRVNIIIISGGIIIWCGAGLVGLYFSGFFNSNFSFQLIIVVFLNGFNDNSFSVSSFCINSVAFFLLDLLQLKKYIVRFIF